MRVLFSCLVVFSLFAFSSYTPAFADEETPSFKGSKATFSEKGEVGKEEREIVVNIKGEVKCAAHEKDYPGIRGKFELKDRNVRFDLFPGSAPVKVSLGVSTGLLENVPVILEESKNCSLKSFEVENVSGSLKDLTYRERLAVMYSPFINIREDQYSKDPYSDVPLAVVYSEHLEDAKKEDEVTFMWTWFFSDENSLTTKAAAAVQPARYGRRTDVEYSNTSKIDVKKGELLKENYHSTFFHQKAEFPKNGTRISRHVVLYNNALNNTFGPTPNGAEQKKKREGYHYVPWGKEAKIESPRAREYQMFARMPWMFDVSDREVTRENKITSRYDEYLYLLIEGTLKGSVKGKLDMGKAGVALAEGWLDRLGEDMWGKQSYSAIPVGRDNLKGIGTTVGGDLTFEVSGTPTFTVTDLKFYRPKGASFEDISEKFDCNKEKSNCRILLKKE